MFFWKSYPFSLPARFQLLNLGISPYFYRFAATQPPFAYVYLCFRQDVNRISLAFMAEGLLVPGPSGNSNIFYCKGLRMRSGLWSPSNERNLQKLKLNIFENDEKIVALNNCSINLCSCFYLWWMKSEQSVHRLKGSIAVEHSLHVEPLQKNKIRLLL